MIALTEFLNSRIILYDTNILEKMRELHPHTHSLSATRLSLARITWWTENASVDKFIIVIYLYCLVISSHNMAALAAVGNPVGSALGLVGGQEDVTPHARGSPVTPATVFNPYPVRK